MSRLHTKRLEDPSPRGETLFVSSTKQVTFPIVLSAIAAICFISVTLFAAAQGQYDLSSPELTFRSCGLAIEKQDAEAYYRALAFPAPVSFEDFVKRIWELKSPEGKKYYGIPCDAVRRTGLAVEYLAEAEFLKEAVRERTQTQERVHWMVKWKRGKVLRKEIFDRYDKEGFWRWWPNPYEHDTKLEDSYVTPTNAYFAVAQALEYRLETEVCRGLAAEVWKGLGGENCARTLVRRLGSLAPQEREGVWQESELRGCTTCLEEESLTGESGIKMCRVWELAKEADGKMHRQRFEVFVEEGGDWKCIPRKDTIWHPDWERGTRESQK